MTTSEKQARPHDELIRELLDSRIPKSEREHAAAREIERLREEVKELCETLEALEALEPLEMLGETANDIMWELDKIRASVINVLRKRSGEEHA